MAWQVCHYFYHGWVRQFWIEPHFLFKYYGFSWVRPWPGNGLYIHVAILGVLALFIAMGFLYRLSTTLFFIGWTYLFLLDEGLWRNHPYLISLFSFLLIFVPANRAFAVDSWLRPSIRTGNNPGVDPLDFAIPNGRRLFFRRLAFDLSIVALLLWRRTRIAAFCLAVVFHLINARLFPLEVFPWFSIAATTLFLSPEWPRRVFTLFRKPAPMHRVEKVAPPVQWKQNLILSAVTVYVAIQALVPLRHFLYHGGIEWWYGEHRFSWRMMIQNAWGQGIFYVTDPNTGRTARVDPLDRLPPWQAKQLGFRPDMIVQFAKYLAECFPPFGPKPVQVEARVSVSLNGRKPELLIDPNVDLAQEKIPLGRPRWLREIHAPLPDPRPDPRDNPFAPKLPGL